MLQNSNKLLTILFFISIYYTTIVYSAFDTRLQIEGDAVVRSDQSIRITNLELTNSVNDAYEEYNSKYGKDTTSMYLILPASSSITYTVEITNKVSDSYLIDSIEEISNTNNNVGVDLSLNINDIIESNSTKTFTITITNDTLSEQHETLVIEYGFKVNRFTLTINPNGGTYNNTTLMSTIQQGYNTYYGLNTPTREGYTFDGWELSGSGDVVRGDASGIHAYTDMTYTSKIDNDGSTYSNFKFNITRTSNTWPSVRYSPYNFTVGHTYRITSMIRVNEYNNIHYLELRNSAVANDWDTPGRKSIYLPESIKGVGWITYTVDRTFNSLTTTHAGSTVDISPRFEIWAAVDANQNGVLDFDIKNVMIEDITDGTQISNDTYNGYIYKFGNGNATLTAKWVTTMDNNVVEYDYTGSSQEFIAPKSGTYKVELWGAQGGTSLTSGGEGAYTSGNITLNKYEKLYIYIGGQGSYSEYNNYAEIFGGYNGGNKAVGQNCCNRNYGSGGGATDIRISIGETLSFSSLKTRIMVAAGGGGSFYSPDDGSATLYGGAGGGLTGYNGTDHPLFSPDYGTAGTGGTQTEGGYATTGNNTYINLIHNEHYNIGNFGSGGERVGAQYGSYTGGGSGYYGGGSSMHVQSAGGGSSFISGYSGCDAIDKDSTSDNIIHTGQANHYSGKVFTDGVMIDGAGCDWSTGVASSNCTGQIQPDGTTSTGHIGNGFARITFIE